MAVLVVENSVGRKLLCEQTVSFRSPAPISPIRVIYKMERVCMVFSKAYCILRNETKRTEMNLSSVTTVQFNLPCDNLTYSSCSAAHNLNKEKTAEVQNMQIWKSVYCETSSSKFVKICNQSIPILWPFSYIQLEAVMICHPKQEMKQRKCRICKCKNLYIAKRALRWL